MVKADFKGKDCLGLFSVLPLQCILLKKCNLIYLAFVARKKMRHFQRRTKCEVSFDFFADGKNLTVL